MDYQDRQVSFWTRLQRLFGAKEAKRKDSVDSYQSSEEWKSYLQSYPQPGYAKPPQDEDFPTGLQCSKFCSYCQAVVDRMAEVKRRHLELEIAAGGSVPCTSEGFVYFETEAALEASAAAGCSLCNRFTESLKGQVGYGGSSGLPDNPECYATLTYYSEHHSQKTESWGIMLRLQRKGPSFYGDNYIWRKVTVDPIAGAGAWPQNSSGSTFDALPQAKEWLMQCIESHEKCQVNLEDERVLPEVLPTRLIDLTTSIARLRLGKDLKGDIKYATLSHCWGTASFTTLTEANLEKFFEEIPSEALPKTFQDAIEIARFLGFKYLWIDSLCIIQDSRADWIYESSLMSGVYGGATLNIAASGASNGSQGCFLDRRDDWRCLIRENPDSSVKSRMLLAYADEGPEFTKRMFTMPLWNRAWAVQERILPRRTLFFTRKEVFWECDNGLLCETYPNGGRALERNSWQARSRRPMTLQGWIGVVNDYSKCALTKSQDKLVAISGIAKIIQQEIGDEYIAGLWRHDLEYQLLWSAKGCCREQKYRAPSWSWAALDGEVAVCWERRIESEKLVISVRNINIQHLSPENPFGEILNATLRIRCDYFIRGSVRRSPSSIKITGLETILPPHHNSISFDAENDVVDLHQACEFKEVFILPIVNDGGKIRALLLDIDQEHPRRYRRIGTARIRLYFHAGGVAMTSSFEKFTGYEARDDDYTEITVVEGEEPARFIDLV